jgi:glutathione reductase (NADPH)
VYKTRFNSLYYGVSDVKQRSLIKLICIDDDERIIGLHGIGRGMDEIVQGFAVAMVMGATR